ncbi:MAG: hypothetical protein AAGI66_02070 [Cyanobacteria bacterium P01_H01_bin.74]
MNIPLLRTALVFATVLTGQNRTAVKQQFITLKPPSDSFCKVSNTGECYPETFPNVNSTIVPDEKPPEPEFMLDDKTEMPAGKTKDENRLIPYSKNKTIDFAQQKMVAEIEPMITPIIKIVVTASELQKSGYKNNVENILEFFRHVICKAVEMEMKDSKTANANKRYELPERVIEALEKEKNEELQSQSANESYSLKTATLRQILPELLSLRLTSSYEPKPLKEENPERFHKASGCILKTQKKYLEAPLPAIYEICLSLFDRSKFQQEFPELQGLSKKEMQDRFKDALIKPTQDSSNAQ